jgi:protein-disulfide isomerase
MSAKKNQDNATDETMTRKQRRAAERAARKGGGSSGSSGSTKSSRPSMLVIAGGAIVIAVIAVVGLMLVSGSVGEESSSVTAAEVPPPAEELQVGRSLGDPEAPVKIDVFEDPQCPACGLFTERIEPLLIAGPVTDGEVFLTYRDMAFLGQESFEAAAAMRAAEELDGKFWEYHDVVFANQSGEGAGAFTDSRLADMAELVGIDREAFLAELEDPKYIAAVEAETSEGRALGVSSTPTLIINGELSPGVPDWDELRASINAATEASEAA